MPRIGIPCEAFLLQNTCRFKKNVVYLRPKCYGRKIFSHKIV